MRPRTYQKRERSWDEATLDEMIARLEKHRRHVAQELGQIDRFLTKHRERCYAGSGCPVCRLRRRLEPGELTRLELVVNNKAAKPVGKKSEPEKPKVLHREHLPPDPPDAA
jgi:hypothetical protein